MSPPHARITGDFIRKGVLAAFLMALSLAFADNLRGGILALVPVVQAAEGGHSSHEEGGTCAGCGGEEGGEHGGGSHASEGSHGAQRGGEKGHGGGTHRGFGGAGRGIGDTIFRGRHSPASGSYARRVEPATRPTSSADHGAAGGGGGPVVSVKGKGDTYGNLWVVLRDPLDGAPVLDANGNVQPILSNGTVVQLTAGGGLPAAYENQIQTVEFSRLNMSRSPSHVLGRALREALSSIASADEVTRDDAGRLVAIKNGIANTIESPMQNLALYVDAIKHGAFTAQQAASFLAAASDKNQPITLDIVVYLNTILGLNGPNGTNYVDYAHYSYDRAETYVGNVTYTIPDEEGRYRTEVAPILEAVFHGENVEKTGADGFAQAADDARRVIEFLHDHGASD